MPSASEMGFSMGPTMPDRGGALNPAANSAEGRRIEHSTRPIAEHLWEVIPQSDKGFSMLPPALRSCLAVAATAAVSAIVPAPAGAAEIKAVPTAPGGAVVELGGIIEPGDDARLAAALATTPRPRGLSLSSLGGNVQAALALGEAVRREGLATTVPARGVCASACGLVWLAGTPRAMGQDAHVGLHAAYLRRNGVSVETGAANALIGAYLGRLGFDDRAIVYLTSAAPDEMTWILPADRQRYNIGYDAASAPTPASSAPDDRFLAKPMALAGAIASAAVAAVDRLLGHDTPAAGAR